MLRAIDEMGQNESMKATGVHGVGARFSCKICSKVLVTKRSLKEHTSRFH